MRRWSTRPFILAMIRAGRPARAWSVSRRIRATSPWRRAPPPSRPRRCAGRGRRRRGARRSGAQPGAFRRSRRGTACRAPHRPIAFHALLHKHAVAGTRRDPREPESHGRRSEIHDGQQLRQTTSDDLSCRRRVLMLAVIAQDVHERSFLTKYARPNPLLRRALASACKGPQDPRVEEPDEPSRARKTVGEVHQRGAALLEPEPIAVGDAQEPREEGGKQRLVADQRHRRGRAM